MQMKGQKTTLMFKAPVTCYKQLLDIQNNQGRGRGYQVKPKAEADNPNRDLECPGARFSKAPETFRVCKAIFN